MEFTDHDIDAVIDISIKATLVSCQEVSDLSSTIHQKQLLVMTVNSSPKSSSPKAARAK